MIPNVGPTTVRKLLQKFGSPVDALKATRSDLMSLERVGAKIADAFVKGVETADVDSVKKKLAAFNAAYISIEDDRYPSLLRNIYDAPIGLFVMGKADLNAPSLALVGCRNCSVYGQSMARKFAEKLARLGLSVVSGVARGIDTAAHYGALDAKATTIGVLGCGLDIIYPPENIDLYRLIPENGALISEYTFGTRADKQTFPMRNRIIAGMTSATVLAESDIKGGGMITARLACDYGKDVFAIPGRLDNPTSAGCHLMIKEGARLATCPEDIAEEMGFAGQFYFENLKKQGAENKDPNSLREDEQRVYETLSAGDACAIDEISSITGLSVQKILAATMMLELKKFILKRSDGRFEKRV